MNVELGEDRRILLRRKRAVETVYEQVEKHREKRSIPMDRLFTTKK